MELPVDFVDDIDMRYRVAFQINERWQKVEDALRAFRLMRKLEFGCLPVWG